MHTHTQRAPKTPQRNERSALSRTTSQQRRIIRSYHVKCVRSWKCEFCRMHGNVNDLLICTYTLYISIILLEKHFYQIIFMMSAKSFFADINNSFLASQQKVLYIIDQQKSRKKFFKINWAVSADELLRCTRFFLQSPKMRCEMSTEQKEIRRYKPCFLIVTAWYFKAKENEGTHDFVQGISEFRGVSLRVWIRQKVGMRSIRRARRAFPSRGRNFTRWSKGENTPHYRGW